MTTKRRYPWQIKPDTGISQPAVVKAPAIVAQVSRVCLSGHEAAAALGVSFGTLETWRRARSGPPSFTAPDGDCTPWTYWSTGHASEPRRRRTTA
ncbi:MAG TPA: hypothetical protein PLF81_10370 [Candidatus Anammoximicrobium sp.]|nr:hypothetical protein [Candidatus Anammoximicrobium sp.]